MLRTTRNIKRESSNSIDLTLMFDNRQMRCTDLCDSLVTPFSGHSSWHFLFRHLQTNPAPCTCFCLVTPSAFKSLQILRLGVLRSPYYDPH